ncbi:hypothetical protein KY363_06650 [Candidatus Woesearchaeota archaeon]|nr:hypothetical protein [Candidatus Woesearchaeota archaeon]
MNRTVLISIIMAFALVFSVSAIGSVDIKESSVSLSGLPGTMNVSQYVNISNTGSSDLNGIVVNSTALSGSAGTIPASAMAFFLSTVNLPAGQSYVDAIMFSIPSTQKAGTYSGTIAAYYNSTNQDTASVTATVLPVYSYSGSADSPSIAKGLSGYITVNVSNTGNADISGMTWRVTNPLVYGSYYLSPTTSSGSLSVSYNSSTSFTVPFTVSSSQAAGTYSGQLNLSANNVNQTLTVYVTVKEPTYSVSIPTVQYDESSRNVNVSKTITITNDGDYTLTGILPLSTTASNTWISGTTPSVLAKGSSFSVTLTSTVPNSVDSGSAKIGTLDFKSNEINKSADIRTDALSRLTFDNVKVSIADASYDTVSDGGTADDDARPGDTFAVKVKLENLFDNDGLDIEDIQITATFYGAGESGDDIDGDSENFDVDAGDKSDEIEIEFDDDIIDWDSNDGKLKMELFADGEDEDGGRHTANYTIYINVKRESKADLIFTRFDVPSTVQCGSSFTIYADGRNVGKDSDDEAVLKIENSNIGISIREEFAIGAYDDDECDAIGEDDDNCMEFEYRTTVQVPTTVGSGTYTITGKLYRKGGDDQTDDADETITVVCDSSSSSSSSSSGSTSSGSTSSGSTSSGASTTGTTTGGSSGTTTATTPGATTSTVQVLYGGGQGTTTSSKGVVATSPTKITDTTKKSGFTDSNAYLALLSVISIVLIIGIIVMLVYAFSSPRD